MIKQFTEFKRTGIDLIYNYLSQRITGKGIRHGGVAFICPGNGKSLAPSLRREREYNETKDRRFCLVPTQLTPSTS